MMGTTNIYNISQVRSAFFMYTNILSNVALVWLLIYNTKCDVPTSFKSTCFASLHANNSVSKYWSRYGNITALGSVPLTNI